MIFFFNQKTEYEMRISDWSSDVCSSDLDFDPRHRSDDVDVTPADDRHHVRENVLFIDTPRRDLRIAGRIHAEGMLDVEFLTSQHAPSRNKPFVALQRGSPILSLSDRVGEIGRAHVSTPVTNAHTACRLLLKKTTK